MALLLTPYTLVMSEKNRLRQLNFTKRREAEGFKRIMFWLKTDEKAYLKKALAAFRENAGEVELNPVKNVNPYQTEILKGEYPFEFEKIKYPYYTIDKPWDNLRYWNNSLPKGILVFADSHKRVKKWRAVALDGLGAFPVLWSIRYALEQRCWDLAPSRTRKINFSKFDVQTEVLRMVGNAKLKVDARFMNSSLGFMTHPIAAQLFQWTKTSWTTCRQGFLSLSLVNEASLSGRMRSVPGERKCCYGTTATQVSDLM